MGKGCVLVLALLTASVIGSLGNPEAAPAGTCPNEQFRVGPSASLSDCRAYELVTPEPNGRLVGSINTFETPTLRRPLQIEMVSPTGDSVAYLVLQGALPDFIGATGVADLYETKRLPGGWKTTGILSPPGSSGTGVRPNGVSPDHSYSVGTVAGNVYLGKAGGSFGLLGVGSLGTEPYAEARYLNEGGEHIVFSTGDGISQSVYCYGNSECSVRELEPEAPPTGTGAVYDRSADGETQVISLLPGNVSPEAGEEAIYKGTSEDGTAVAFTIEGTLYVRLDNQETVEVTSNPSTFAGLSDDGHYIFYLSEASGEAGNIHRFDTSTEADVEINTSGDGEIVNVSGDGSHVYFISPSQLDGGNGGAGQPNLYVWSGTSPEYITTVLPSDLEQTSGPLVGLPALARWTGWVANQPEGGFQGPGNEASRTIPDGSVLVFESRGQLTAYDNDGHTEVYRFDDDDNSLTCASCNPIGEPASADARLQELKLVNSPTVVRNLTNDGSRIFFESSEALVVGDTDGVNDIYQWSEEEGGSSSLDLISSGQSTQYPVFQVGFSTPVPNVLLSVTRDGRDVAFLSQDALVAGAGDGGVTAIYDARVNGGFPSTPNPAICFEDGCKRPAAALAPGFLSPPSMSLHGSGNVKPRHPKRRCRAHFRKAGWAHHKRRGRCTRRNGNGHRSPVAASSSASVDGWQRPKEAEAAGGTEAPKEAQGESTRSTPVAAFAENPFDFGIEAVSAGESTAGAGLHPDFSNLINFNHIIKENGQPDADARVEDVSVSLPPGLLGNPSAIPQCATGAFLALQCPLDTQVGITNVLIVEYGELVAPVFNLEPPHPEEEVARFGFTAALYPIFIDIKVRTAGDYGATGTVYGASGYTSLVSAETTLWGNPPDPSHDELRMDAAEASDCHGPCGGKNASDLPPTAFMTNPSACQPMDVEFSATSYQLPGQVFEASAPMDPITGCQGLPFEPSFEAEPTSHSPGAPTGLRTKLLLPQHLGADEKATATMREARVTLPAGMQIAAGAANWIGTCSEAQIGYHEKVDAACPDSSKVGTATITSPDLPVPIDGAIYQRSPQPGHQFGLWLTSDALGLHVKIPGELEPDKATGRLTAVFRDLPQVPVEEIDLNVWGGPRAPLQNPDSCGTYTTDYSFSPHSEDPAVTGQSEMQIDEACNQPFSPTLHAGVTDPVAGRFSPLIIDLTREDGQQQLRGFELELPDGELAKIKGVPLCPDAAAAAGSCPAETAIGHLVAATGPGPEPLWVPQPGKAEPRLYLAGPYEGSPFSVVTEVPAQAGPFDLGTLVVRSGLGLDPETNRAVVKAEPLPQFFEGVGLIYRRVHAVVDRPKFSLNPTDCREMRIEATATSTQGTLAHPAARFQVDGCKRLKFKPRLSFKLRGGTKRGDYPALIALLKARKGDANIARTSVALPHSEFLAQEHIATICTRKQFAADKCPKGSIYGKAKAFTPLLAKPLEGPVYLRSSSHLLPDMVVALGGELDVNLVGRIDSHKGGIRSTFAAVPDAPLTRFVLRMKGGAKGLLVNSTDICLGRHRAQVAMRGQNGSWRSAVPTLRATGCARSKH
jgi:hypothetical protein